MNACMLNFGTDFFSFQVWNILKIDPAIVSGIVSTSIRT